MPKYDIAIARWQVLYRDLVVLETIKKNNPKKLIKIRLQLESLIGAIEKIVKIGIPEEEMNKKLRGILNECNKYYKRVLAA